MKTFIMSVLLIFGLVCTNQVEAQSTTYIVINSVAGEYLTPSKDDIDLTETAVVSTDMHPEDGNLIVMLYVRGSGYINPETGDFNHNWHYITGISYVAPEPGQYEDSFDFTLGLPGETTADATGVPTYVDDTRVWTVVAAFYWYDPHADIMLYVDSHERNIVVDLPTSGGGGGTGGGGNPFGN